ncbi:flagellar hook assembly protein FlgD [Rhodocista pekingensis]|uniref:Basal-body rod modification protein FlgD n=1 Tax=Rhodocista pekingensis TaxID=201185 RepID=A0ABW2KYV6_9PROT
MTTVASPSAAGTQQTTADVASVRLAQDTQSFLKLLTAQLANQDPMAPIDATQFVTQLAQFSSVEQAVQSNTRLAEVLGELRSSSERLDLAYVGRTVEIESDALPLTGGAAKASYTVPEDTEKTEIRILDKDGTIVRTLEGSSIPGSHLMTWDGLDDNGVKVADGIYQIDVAPRNPAGDRLASTVQTADTVERVRRVDGESVFVMRSGLQVQRDQIVSAG